MTKPLISLCMIVKNEENVLERCLNSVKELVDEIIIVDTGSTDKTVEIAERFQAVILRYEWNNDFSAARNVGIDAATGKWILILDADEEMEKNIHNGLKEGAMKYEDGVFQFPVKNYLDETYTNIQTTNSIRMFLNKPKHRYNGKIHEQIIDSVFKEDPNTRIYVTPFSIYHYGYTKEQVETKNKNERNITSLKEALENNPNDCFYLYYLGVEYLRLSDFKQAYNNFHKSRLKWKVSHNILAVVYKCEAYCLFEIGEKNKAIKLLVEATKRFPSYTDLFHTLGIMYKKEKKFDKAKRAYLKAIDLGVTTEFETQSGIGTYLTYFLLGKMEEERGFYKDSLYYYEQSLQHAGKSSSIQVCIDRVKNIMNEKE